MLESRSKGFFPRPKQSPNASPAGDLSGEEEHRYGVRANPLSISKIALPQTGPV